MTDRVPLFAFDDVVVEGDDARILDAVTAAVDADGITCLLGPSGAGKSTMLRLCNRLEVADAGTVAYRGTDVTEIDPLQLRRRVGMVFQRPTVFPGTVRDNLVVAATDADEERLAGALQRAQLDPAFLDRQADSLSGGEAQRVCVARTLITGPEALLMDEPTSALDPAARRGVERLTRALADGGVPVIWVTHDLSQADRIADDVVVLIDGRVVTTGPMAAIRTSPHAAVQAFLAGDEADGQHDGGEDGEDEREER